MTAATAEPGTGSFDDRRTRTTIWHVIKSEWVKFWGVRSTPWTLLILFVATVGISVLASWGTSISLDQMPKDQRATLDVVNLSLAGIGLGQLAIAVLGALVITTEYSTGGIKATLTAVPERAHVLLAKAVVFALTAVVVGLITSFVSFYAAMPFWTAHDLGVGLNDPHVLRAVLGGGLYILASGLFGFALGVIIRHTAGAIAAAVALLLIVPPILQALPGDWGDTVYKYFTSNAGGQVATTVPSDTLLSPWPGYLVMTIWWLALLLIGGYLMKRRDA